MTSKVIKDTKYCQILSQGKLAAAEYTYCIEKIFNKDTIRSVERYIFETSEDTPNSIYLEYWLKNYGSQGILNLINGIIIGKPYDNKYYEEYKKVILKIVRDELGFKDLPIMYNMNFGHTAPMITIPYGCVAEIDCDKAMFRILESGVI